MKIRFFLLHIILLCSITFIYSQRSIGTWQTHISYFNINQIDQSKDKIYGVSAGGALFSIQKEDNLIETYSKISGLNGQNIHLIKYSEYNNLLLIAYQNSNIDLLFDDGSVTNIADLYRKNMSGSKKINDICFIDNFAFIACDFGIIVLNITKKEIFETYIINESGNNNAILNIFNLNNNIYALTSDNILIGNRNQNLLNYQNWQKLSNPNESVQNKKMIINNNTIYLLKQNNVVYKYENEEWKQYKTEIKNISTSNNTLFTLNTSDELSMDINKVDNFISNNAVDAIYDKNKNIVWFIANNIVNSKNTNTNEYNSFYINGPLSNTSWRLKYSDGRIYSIPGGRWAVNYNTPGSLSYYENLTWHNLGTGYFETKTETTNTCYDLVDIAIDPNDKTHFWIASYGLGLYEFRNDTIYKFHHCDNSGLNTIFPNGTPKEIYNYIRIDGLTYDENGNLWILNNGDGNLIKYIDPDGVYHEIPNDIIVSHKDLTTQDIIISNKKPNLKIFLMPRYRNTNNSILYSLDDNGTLDYVGDDKAVAFTKVYDQDNKELSFNASPLLRSIAQDKNGVLWIGTTQGLFLINNPEKMFEENFRVHRIKIPRNDGTGLADYLLGTEEIKVIVVDGANRKWIGTASSGIYLVSEDGLETIHHFTAENSPLLSNTIQSIAINEKTGEVFIGTGNGLISYHSDAVEGGEYFENVRAFPNPIRPEYSGLITIVGLTSDTQVRITDINGNVIYETISNGGVATWDGCQHSGDRVASGVYFAHCVSANTKQKIIVKILIIK